MVENGKSSELRKSEMLLFASADVFGGGGQAVISVLYLVYLTNVLGFHPAWAGMVVMVSKIWDAVSDPLMGVISDNTRSRFGRRRPYLFFGGLALIVSIALLWYPLNTGTEAMRILFMTVTYLLYSTVSTVISVPYSSMSTEITGDFSLCNRVNMLRLVFSLTATAVCTLLPTVFFDRLISGQLSLWAFYSIIVFGFGSFFAIPVIFTGLFAKERAPYDSYKSKFNLSTFVLPLKVRAFRKLLILYLAQSITLDIISAVIIYYGLYVVPGMNSTIFLGTFLGMQILLFPLLNSLINRVSKTRIYRFGLPLSIACAAVIAFFPTGSTPAWIYVLSALTALGFAGAQTMTWIMFPDVVDIGTLSLGKRITGSFSGVMTFIRKSSSAVAIFTVGNVLGVTGFITPTDMEPTPIQPDATILALRLIILMSFVLLMGSAWLVAGRFNLSPELSRRVKYFLEVHNDGAKKSLSKDERMEVESILKEFG